MEVEDTVTAELANVSGVALLRRGMQYKRADSLRFWRVGLDSLMFQGAVLGQRHKSLQLRF
jgi:hypothetical protein